MHDSQSAAPGSELPDTVQEAEPAGSINRCAPVSIQIARVVKTFWLRRQKIFRLLSIGILLSIAYAASLPAIYTSRTTLMPPSSSSSNSNLMGLLSSAGPSASIGNSLLGVKTPGAVFVGVLGSRTVQESLVSRFDLVPYYKVHLVDDACKRLAASTIIMEDPKNGIISISVDDKNPMLASKMAQGYVEELDRVMTYNGTSAAGRERIFLEGRLKEIKQDLDDSSKALSQFSTKNRAIDIPSQAIATIDAGLKMQAELAASRSELAGLQQSYSDDNVRVRAAQARVDELQSQMNKISGLSQENSSKSISNKSDYPSVEELPTLGLTYSDLKRRVTVDEALWEALNAQYESAKVQEAKDIPTVRVLDMANVPQHKSAPVRSYIVILGAMGSLFVACIFVVAISAWEAMDSQDERKKLVTEIVSTMRHSHKWLRWLPEARMTDNDNRA